MNNRFRQKRTWKKSVAILAAASVCCVSLALPAAADAYKSRTPDADQADLQWVADVKDATGQGSILSLASADDGVIGVGWATGGEVSGYLVKTATDGSVKWSNRISASGVAVDYPTKSDSGQVHINSITKLSNGNYVAVGYYQIPSIYYKAKTINVTISDTLSGQSFSLPDVGHGKNNDEGLVITFDTDGKILTANAQGSTGDDSFDYVAATSDGGYIVLGSAGSNDGDFATAAGSSSFYEKFDSSGGKEWIQYEAGRNYWLTSIAQNADGTYFAVGADYNTDGVTDEKGNVIASAGPAAVAVKFASDGSSIWTKTESETGSADVFSGLVPTSDGGLVAVGSRTDDSTSDPNYLAVKFDADGGITWAKSYGGMQDDHLNSVVQQQDGTYVAYGLSGSQDGDLSDSAINSFAGAPGNSEMTLVKLEKDGSLGWICNAGGSAGVVTNGSMIQVGNQFFIGGYTGSTDGVFSNLEGGSDFIAAFSYDNDNDGITNLRDAAKNDASQGIDTQYYSDNADLSAAAQKTLTGENGSLLVTSYDDYYLDDGVTPLPGMANLALQFGAVSVKLPALALDNLFYIYKAPKNLTFGVKDITVSTSVDGEKVLYAGDITIKDPDGTKLDTDDLGNDVQVTLTLPDNSGYDTGKSPKLVHIKSDGTSEDVSGAVFSADGKTVTFTTNHFSTYAVVQTADNNDGTGSGDNGGSGGSGTTSSGTASSSTSSDETSNPVTGTAGANTALPALIALAAAGASGAALTLRRRKH